MTVVWRRGPVEPRQKRYTARVYWPSSVVGRDEPHFELSDRQDFNWLWQAKSYVRLEVPDHCAVEIIDNHKTPSTRPDVPRVFTRRIDYI